MQRSQRSRELYGSLRSPAFGPSSSTSAIARAGHTGTGPGQAQTSTDGSLAFWPVNIEWVKGRSGVPGNEKADGWRGEAVEKSNTNPVMSIAHLKLKISERFRKNKEKWHWMEALSKAV